MKNLFILAALAATVLAQLEGPGMNVTAPKPGTNITMLTPFEVDIVKLAKNPVQIDLRLQIDAISWEDGVPRNLYNSTFNITQDVPPTAMIHVVPANLPKGPALLNITHYYTAGGDPTIETESTVIKLNVVG